jgi:hypothetical protein
MKIFNDKEGNTAMTRDALRTVLDALTLPNAEKSRAAAQLVASELARIDGAALRRTRTTAAMVATAIKMRNDRHKLKSIAAMLGVSVSTVFNMINPKEKL